MADSFKRQLEEARDRFSPTQDKPQVEVSLDCLEQVVIGLENYSEQLQSRLAPVLMPVGTCQPSGECGPSPTPVRCPLADAIGNLTARLGRVTGRLLDIRDNLQV